MKIIEKLLTVNPYSRPGKALAPVKGIVVHWVANPKTTVEQNRNYFESLKHGVDERYAGAHFIIGLEGEVLQCLLENEVGYHVGAQKYTERALQELSSYPNNCTLGIELCHTNWEGEFTEATLESAKELIRELCERYNLGRRNVYRHFDITGKDCPKYFVAHEDQWIQYLNFVFCEKNETAE
ncbi:MAG: N-acetylmuramoyl-L-alanine amidase [Treponema sp.]|jgi:N-acetylmuramoyl-L-alanine amidase|nr:N-acetylmuramoyl-L-alanine amidase [Treponema sp.]